MTWLESLLAALADDFPPAEVAAEAPAEGEEKEGGEEEKDGEGEEEGEKEGGEGGEGGEDGEDGEGGEDAEEEEEEEEEPEDPMPRIQEECMASKACSPAKHHYDECVERVTQQIEENEKAEEDCVEEFFHLMHCANACAAPKLFRQLK